MPHKLGVVKFNFIPINEDLELRLQKGQEVLILEQDAVNGWARGLLVEPNSALSSSIQELTSGTTTAGLRRRAQREDGEKKKGSHILSPYLREAREQGLVRLFPGSHVRVLHVFQEEGSGLEHKRGSKETDDFAVEDYSPLSTPREIEKERERSISAGSELESTPGRHNKSRNRNFVTAAKARLGFSATKGTEGAIDSDEQAKEKKLSTRDRMESEVLTRPRAQSAGERSSAALHRLVHGSSDQSTESGSEGDYTTDEDRQQANEENGEKEIKPRAGEKKSRRKDRLLKLASLSDMGKRRSMAPTKEQSLMRESSIEELAKSLRRRVHVMREIYETERTYVRTLETVVEVYMRPLHECISTSKIGLSPRIVPRVFGNVELLLNLQRIILGELELRVSSGLTANTCLGDVFLKMIPFLKSYTQYVNNYPESIAAMTLLVKDKRFLEFLQSRAPKGSLGGDYVLSDLLITPIQRLPRYEMLLKDLLKVTPEDHQDYADLSKAALQITEVARYVNSRRAEFETTNKILDIQSKFVNSNRLKPVTLIKPSRRLVREGQAEVQGEDRILYLFNDCLLIASIKPGDRRGLKHNLSLFGASVYTPSTPPTTFGFEFVFKTGGSTQEVTFLVHSQKELQEWMHDLQQSIDSFTSKKTQIMTAGNLPLHLWCKAGDLAKIQEHFERTSIGGIEDQEESSLDVNARNSAGKTALMIAAKQGNMAIVKYLVEVAGASVNLRMANGVSAHDIATAAGHEAIAEFLAGKEKALLTPRLTPRDGPIMPTSASVGDIASDSATFVQSIEKLKKRGKAKLLTLKRSVASPWAVTQAHPTPAEDAQENAVLNIKKELCRLDARSKELKNQLVEVLMEKRKWEEKLDKVIATRRQSSAPIVRHQSNPTLVTSSSGDSIPEEPTESVPTTLETYSPPPTPQEQPFPSPPQHRPQAPPRVPPLRMRISRSISPIAQS